VRDAQLSLFWVEDLFETLFKDASDSEGKRERGSVLALLDGDDCLAGDFEMGGEVLLG
jgi:hypothetical protein